MILNEKENKFDNIRINPVANSPQTIFGPAAIKLARMGFVPAGGNSSSVIENERVSHNTAT